MKWAGAVRDASFEPKTFRGAEIPAFRHTVSLGDLLAGGDLSAEEAVFLYTSMITQRFFELIFAHLKGKAVEGISENVRDYLTEGELDAIRYAGAAHLYVGQEAVAAPLQLALRSGDMITSSHRGHGHAIGIGIEVEPMIWEMFGKADGCCGGVGGSMHITGTGSTGIRSLGANGVVGGGFPIAVGAGISAQKLGTGAVVFCMAGDGAMNTGSFHEAVNMAAQLDVPVGFMYEDNGAGMTGRVDQVTGFKNEAEDIGQLVRRAWAYLPNESIERGAAELVNGLDPIAVLGAYRRSAKLLREGHGPTFTVFETMRYVGHSLSDDTTTYRSPQEIERWARQDAVANYAQALQDSGVADSTQLEDIRARTARRIIDAVKGTDAKADRPVSSLLNNVYADAPEPELAKLPCYAQPEAEPAARTLTYRQAIAEAVRQLFDFDTRTYYWGEDCAEYGGAFAITCGLKETHGDRIWNTAISENAIVGAGLGAALTGLKPMVEIMYSDFLAQAQDQVQNQAALNRFMYGGNRTPGFVIVTTIGGGKSYACQHGKEVVSQYTFPGMRIAVPSNPADAKGLLAAALYSGDPVIFFEHQLLLEKRGKVPEELYAVPFGKARVVTEGADVTLWGYAKMVDEMENAARALKKEGISAEVIDPRTLNPMDYDTLRTSVEKTGHLVLCSQGVETLNVVHTVASRVLRMVDRAVKFETVTAPDGIIPTAQNLERAYLPNQLRVVEKVCQIKGMSPEETREKFARLYDRYERD